MSLLRRFAALLSDLRLAIVLLLLIAIASAIGTILPQGEDPALYLNRFNADPWLGLINGDRMLQLQLDQVYSSAWFLTLLAWLGLALILCSWRRQWPALQAAMRWIDYREPRQLSKLALAESIVSEDPDQGLQALAGSLQSQGWQVQVQTG